MAVVTMSGTIASGAREIGQAAASLLGIDYVDQQLLVDAARRLGVPVDVMAGRDERCSSFGERLSAVLRGFLERSAAGGDPLTGAGGLEVLLGRTYADLAKEREEPEVSDALYMKTMTAIIRELGDRGNIVVLGRGSQMILRDLPGALHVLTLAPQALRIERLAGRGGHAAAVPTGGRMGWGRRRGRGRRAPALSPLVPAKRARPADTPPRGPG